MDADDLSCLPEQRRFAFVGCRYDEDAAERGMRGHDAGVRSAR